MVTSLEGHATVLPPLDESVAAMEHTRKLLDDALVALDSDDDEQLTLAYEHAAECADHIARALWFLYRTKRDPQSA